MTTTFKHRMATAEAELIAARGAVASLRARLDRIDEQLAAAAERGPGDDFDDYVARGTVGVTVSTTAELTAERATVAGLIDVGERRVAATADRMKTIEREWKAAAIAAMTMDDAVMFARDALSAIDVDGCVADLAKIESTLQGLDQERLQARGAYEAAAAKAHSVAKRYQGSPDQVSGTSLEDLRAAENDALALVNRLRDRTRAAERRHENLREDIKVAVAMAFEHVNRLALTESVKVEKYAAAVSLFAKSLASPARAAQTPTALTIELPSSSDVAELTALSASALELVQRQIPSIRQENEYAPRPLQEE